MGPATVLAQEKGRSQEQHEEAHGTVWIVVQGRLMRCAPGHLRHLSERESLSLDREKGVEEKGRTCTDIVQDFKFSKGTHVDLRSQSDPPEGSEPRHLSGRIFFENANRDVWNESRVERIQRRYLWLSLLLSRATLKWKNRCLSHLTPPETRPVTETDEMRMETDDHATEIPVPEPPLAAPPVRPPQLTRHRIYGKR